MRKSAKAGGGRCRELSDRLVTLQRRLHQALMLGFRNDGDRERIWECSDVSIQVHAIQAMSAFVSNLSHDMVPLVKTSITDILIALESILHSRNDKVLLDAMQVLIQLITSLGNSVNQYSFFGIIGSLLALLSNNQMTIFNSSIGALNSIFLKMANWRLERHQDTWKTIQENNVVDTLVSSILKHIHGRKSNAFVEIVSLLRTILCHWPASRYAVWSNAKLMMGLEASLTSLDSLAAAKVLQLYSALALCSYGESILVENVDKLIPSLVHLLKRSQPHYVRIDALIFFQCLTRSPYGCSKIADISSGSVFEQILNAMNSWKLQSSESNADQLKLVMEACRSALVTRWPGRHHLHLRKLGIVQCLYDLLSYTSSNNGAAPSTAQSDQPVCLSSKSSYIAGPSIIRSFVWEILGWLVIYDTVDTDFNLHGDEHKFDFLISHACQMTLNFIREWPKVVQKIACCDHELGATFRAVLFFIYSPRNYVASKAQELVSKCLLSSSGKYVAYLFRYLSPTVSGDFSSLHNNKSLTVYNLIGVLFHLNTPQFWDLFPRSRAFSKIWAFTVSCLGCDIQVRWSNIASHLQDSHNCRTCCRINVDWDGDNVMLFYSLWVLCELLRANFVNNKKNSPHDEINSDLDSLKPEMVQILESITSGEFSHGVRWYAASCLSFLGYYGFSYKYGKKLKKALGDGVYSDMQFVLSNDYRLKVHRAILMAACPSLLPPEALLPIKRSLSCGIVKDKDSGDLCSKIQLDVRLSSQVDNDALVKLLEFIYAGFIHDDEPCKQLEYLSKRCKLQSLSDLLIHRRPQWGTSIPKFDLRSTLGQDSCFWDCILEAEPNEENSWTCTLCNISKPHEHVHRIILTSGCDYLQALFQSGMEDSCSYIIKVPVGWNALTKLVSWFYSGELPGLGVDCVWINLGIDQQLQELKAYVELASLSDFWCLDDVWEECFSRVLSYLPCNPLLSFEIMQIAINLNQVRIVDAAVDHVAPLYPQFRDQGKLAGMSEELSNIVRARFVHISQEQWPDG